MLVEDSIGVEIEIAAETGDAVRGGAGGKCDGGTLGDREQIEIALGEKGIVNVQADGIGQGLGFGAMIREHVEFETGGGDARLNTEVAGKLGQEVALV